MKNIWIIIIYLLLVSNLHATVTINTNNTDIYQKIKQKLNPKKPGFGPSDYGKFDIVDIPKAYAMFLSSELMNYKRFYGDYNLTMAVNAGNWILDNKDLNHDGIIGWGVPVAWDAFGDKSINEKNTEYTIATGIVLNSLMDWLELAPKTAPKEEILNTIKQAIQPYLKANIFSSSGLFNYSLKEEDRKYNCFNAAIYMAGQMQRFTMFISDTNLKNKIKLSTDRVMSATLKYQKVDPKGGWYWSYSVEQNNVPNDLAHACYTIDGIMTYIRNKGTLSNLFDTNAILKHFDFFSAKSGKIWYLFPSFFRIDRTPRIYGLGMTLYIYSKYIKDTKKIDSLLNYLEKYKLSNSLYSRYQNEKVIVTEYLTYIMYGIASSYYFKQGCDQVIYLHSDKEHKEKIKKLFQNITLNKVCKIPFTSMEQGGVQILFNTLNYYPEVHMGRRVFTLDEYKAVPVKLLVNRDTIIVILRELLSNNLIIARIDKKTNSIYYKKTKKKKEGFYDFREADIFNNQLVIVAYESQKSQNTLLVFSLENNLKKQSKFKLPSVEYPSGGTYEVIPKMMMLKSLDNKQLYIISGRLFGMYDGSSFRSLDVNQDIKFFEEAIITDKNEIYALYLDKFDKHIIANMTQKSTYYIAPKGEVVFGLNYYYDKVQFKKLISVNDLKELIKFDFLHNKGSGTLYLGTNNIEGWLAWSQIYYLNGMLSFLELAQNDIEFYENLQIYIPEIKKRLDLEIKLFLYQMNSKESLKCRIFTVDRSLATFAVQSSRFALLLHRYLKLFPNKKLQKKFEELKQNVLHLKDHMETLEKGTSNIVLKYWNPINAYYLKWPKGCKFKYDGTPVPYNHQNEWSTFIFETTEDKHELSVAESIVNLFLFNITKQANQLPHDTRWPYFGKDNEHVWFYWWGKAWEGWEADETISEHTKKFQGDKITSHISFRTIDAIAVLSAYVKTHRRFYKKYIKQIKSMIHRGYLFPYASSYLREINCIPKLNKKTMATYTRFTSPWEFDNSVWSYLSFIKFYSNKYKINDISRSESQ